MVANLFQYLLEIVISQISLKLHTSHLLVVEVPSKFHIHFVVMVANLLPFYKDPNPESLRESQPLCPNPGLFLFLLMQSSMCDDDSITDMEPNENLWVFFGY